MRLTEEERRIADEVALRLYFDPMRAGDAWECALQYIETRREAFGDGPQVSPDEAVSLRSETPASATAAGVAAPPADASDEVVAWMVASPTGDASAVFHVREEAVRFARGVHGIVPLVRQGSPRGVVVTEAQRWAIKRAASILRRLGYHEFDPWPGVEARSLDDLLAAIDAAKGGGE